MHVAGEVLWSFESALDKGFVDDHLRREVSEFTSLPLAGLTATTW